MINYALQILVVVMMAATGLDLQLTQVRRSLRRAHWVQGAVALNLVIVPVAVWATAEVAQLSPGTAAGLILCAAAPAGPVGLVLCRLSKADMGFAAGLMVLLGLLGLVSTPLAVTLLVDLDPVGQESVVLPMFIALLIFQIVPLGVAMATASRAPGVAARLARPLRLVSNLMLVGIVGALLVLKGDTLGSVPIELHLWLVGGMLLLLGPVLGSSPPGSMRRSLLTITSVRNMSVALFLSTRFFDDPEVEAAILIWSFWMVVLPGAMGWFAGRYRTTEWLPQIALADSQVPQAEFRVCPAAALARVGVPASFIKSPKKTNRPL